MLLLLHDEKEEMHGRYDGHVSAGGARQLVQAARLVLEGHLERGELLEHAHMLAGQRLPGGQVAHRDVLQAVVDGQRARVVGQPAAVLGYAQQVADERRLALGVAGHEHLGRYPVRHQIVELDHLVDALAQVVVDEQRVLAADGGRVDGLAPVAVDALGARVQAVAHVYVHEVVPLDERELCGDRLGRVVAHREHLAASADRRRVDGRVEVNRRHHRHAHAHRRRARHGRLIELAHTVALRARALAARRRVAAQHVLVEGLACCLVFLVVSSVVSIRRRREDARAGRALDERVERVGVRVVEEVEDVARFGLVVLAHLVAHKRVDLVGELAILLEVDDEEAVDPHGDQIDCPLHHGHEARVAVFQTFQTT